MITGAEERVREVSFSVTRIGRWLVVLVAALLCAHLAVTAVIHFTNHDHLKGLLPLFNLDRERNIPSYVSGALFLLGAFLQYLLSKISTHRGWVWRLTAVVFAICSFDELFEHHEKLGEMIRESLLLSGYLQFPWFLVIGPIVLVLVPIFFPVWWRLPHPERSLAALSAVTFLSGSIGMELIGGERWGRVGPDSIYLLYVFIEEGFELCGLTLFVYCLLRLLAREGVTLMLER